MMCNTCDDNRFQLIEKYKAEIVAATNIAGCKEEMDVLDNILFRFWQIGWLDKLEKPTQQWIPCSERLPEKSGKYLVSCKANAYSNITTTAQWQNRYKYWYMTGARSHWRVDAWMQLPEPYKGE